MKSWCNKQMIGLAIGLVLPVICSLVLFKTRYYGGLEYWPFVLGMFKLHSLGKLVSISVLPNLAVFFVAVWKERLLAARGIVLATMLYTVGVVAIWFAG